MAATADSHQQVLAAGERNSSHDIDHIGTADESRRVLVNPAVPDPACLVVVPVTLADESTMHPRLEILQGYRGESGVKHGRASSVVLSPLGEKKVSRKKPLFRDLSVTVLR